MKIVGQLTSIFGSLHCFPETIGQAATATKNITAFPSSDLNSPRPSYPTQNLNSICCIPSISPPIHKTTQPAFPPATPDIMLRIGAPYPLDWQNDPKCPLLRSCPRPVPPLLPVPDPANVGPRVVRPENNLNEARTVVGNFTLSHRPYSSAIRGARVDWWCFSSHCRVIR